MRLRVPVNACRSLANGSPEWLPCYCAGVHGGKAAATTPSDRPREAVHVPAGNGRSREAISLGSGPEGHLIRRKISGKTKAIVADQLAQLHRDLGWRLAAPTTVFVAGIDVPARTIT